MTEPEHPQLILSGDQARISIAEDEFGLAEMADAIASALTSRLAQSGYVIGIDGVWGSGKTTLLNFVRESLAKSRQPSRFFVFEPWLIGKKEALLRIFFDQLADEIVALYKAYRLEGHVRLNVGPRIYDLEKKLRVYGRFTAELVSTSAGAVSLGSHWLALAAIPLKLLAAIIRFFGRSKPLERLRQEIADDLQSIANLAPGFRITVAVDDMDRLEPAEAVEVLRLIKSVASFPAVTYIVCFDGKVLARQIRTVLNVKNGLEYIEKLFPMILTVPPQEPFALTRFLRRELTRDFPDEMQKPVDNPDVRERQQYVLSAWVQQVVRTPRDVIRIRESVRLGWPHLKGRADFTDFVWLQLVKVRAPKLFDWTRRYLSEVGAYRDAGTASSGEAARMGNELHEIMAKDVGWQKERMFLSGLDDILPGVSGAFEGKDHKVFEFEENELDSFEGNQRLGSPSHWRRYFAFASPTYAISDDELAEFGRRCEHDHMAAAEMIRALLARQHEVPGHFVSVLLDRFAYKADQRLSKKCRQGILHVFADVMDEAAQVGGFQHGRGDIWQHSLELLSKDCAPDIQQATQDGKSVNWLAYVLLDQAYAHGIGAKERSQRQWLTSEELKTGAPMLLERCARLGLRQILKMPAPLDVLNCWRVLGDLDAVSSALDDFIEQDEDFLDFMGAMEGIIVSSNKGTYRSINPGVVQLFTDVTKARMRLELIATNTDSALAAPAKQMLENWSEVSATPHQIPI